MTSTVNHCFCELAPLYVLGLLDDAKQEWVEQQIIAIPELAEELAEYQAAVTALPYGITPLVVDPGLKNRLFSGLGLTLHEDVPMEAETSKAENNSFLTMRFQNLVWRKHPVPGVEVSILHTDFAARRRSGVLKAAPGMCYPLHRHRGVEEIYMISGDLIVGDDTYGAGDYIRSYPGSAHTNQSQGGCMFFFNTSMDDEYFESADTGSIPVL